MSRKLFLVVTTIIFCGLGTVLLPRSASADVPLRKATIQDLIRQVRLIRQNQNPRPAVKGASMTLGDALSTARSSRADVRFDDGSLTRLGELALFRFTPGSRDFYLSNGTMLLLIPPKRGRTNVSTPNASAGIRGSALFVRYDAATNTTIIGALTDNPNGPMDILNKDGSQKQELKSGQMVVLVGDRIQKLYEFDLKTFYETSELVKGLDLTKENGANPDGDIAAVQGETSEAFEKQSKAPIQGEGVTQGRFVGLSPINSEFYEETQSVANTSNGVKPPNSATPETVYKEGVQPWVKTETSIAPEQPGNQQLPVVTNPPGNQQPPIVSGPVVTPNQPPNPAPIQTPVAQPTQQYQPPQSIPTPQQATQTPAPTPIQVPVTPVQTPVVTPVVTPSAPPVQVLPPTPVVTPSAPPIQVLPPTPVVTPSAPPVQVLPPTPVVTPSAPPIQVSPPTAIPTPTQAPVLPPVQQNILPSLPNSPAAVQTPAGRIPTTTPSPTLAPALAPATPPESPSTTRQGQQTVR